MHHIVKDRAINHVPTRAYKLVHIRWYQSARLLAILLICMCFCYWFYCADYNGVSQY